MSERDNASDNASDKHSDKSNADDQRRGPQGPAALLNRLLGDDNSVKEQIDRNARALAQSALSKLDVVSRQEFDAQSSVLKRTRERLAELELELERLSRLLDDNH